MTLGIQLEKDSHKKSLKSQSSLGSCYSLAPQRVSQLFKWARDLPWTRWRSINTPHEVQGSANRFTLKMGSPDALHRASGDTSTANCTVSDRSPDATSQRPVLPSGATVRCSEEVYNLPEFRTGRYPASLVLEYGDLGHYVDLPGFRTGRYPVSPVLASSA